MLGIATVLDLLIMWGSPGPVVWLMSTTRLLTGARCARVDRSRRGCTMRTPTIDFVGKAPRWAVVSAVLLLAGIVSITVRGLDLSIDFVGGTSYTLTGVATTSPPRSCVRRPRTRGRDVIAQLQLDGDRARRDRAHGGGRSRARPGARDPAALRRSPGADEVVVELRRADVG
jgi:hypothetical protein